MGLSGCSVQSWNFGHELDLGVMVTHPIDLGKFFEDFCLLSIYTVVLDYTRSVDFGVVMAYHRLLPGA